MPAASTLPPLDPAMDAAALLRRMGFVCLMMALPLASTVSRRAVVVLAPIGIALLVLASLLDKENLKLSKALRTPLNSWISAACALWLGWAGLSLLWTPYPAAGTERLSNILIAFVLGLAGYLALPERMRAANYYLAPIGIALAALAAFLFQIWGWMGQQVDTDRQSLFRGLIVITLFAWPAIAWLVSRRRHREALGLAALVALATIPNGFWVLLSAFVLGSGIFLACLKKPDRVLPILSLSLASLVLVAPALPFILKPLEASLHLSAPLALWRDSILQEPLRLITGHGFETVLRGRASGILPTETPSSLLFEIWYELGLIGAGALAAALGLMIRSLNLWPVSLMAGMAAAITSAFFLSVAGIATTQIWWITFLAVLAVAFAALQRTQYETRRPKAFLLGLPAPGYLPPRPNA